MSAGDLAANLATKTSIPLAFRHRLRYHVFIYAGVLTTAWATTTPTTTIKTTTGGEIFTFDGWKDGTFQRNFKISTCQGFNVQRCKVQSITISKFNFFKPSNFKPVSLRALFGNLSKRLAGQSLSNAAAAAPAHAPAAASGPYVPPPAGRK